MCQAKWTNVMCVYVRRIENRSRRKAMCLLLQQAMSTTVELSVPVSASETMMAHSDCSYSG